MAVISATSICNEALTFLGETPLLDFPEESQNSDRCKMFYERVKEGELSKHSWNFAIQRSTLTRDTVTPDSEYAYRFVLPPGHLRTVATWPRNYEWRREGQFLLTDSSTMKIKYIKNVDEGVFSPTFAPVVSARLAMLLAGLLTERDVKFTAAAQWYSDAYDEARRVDSQESSVDEMDDTIVVTARYNNVVDSFLKRPVST